MFSHNIQSRVKSFTLDELENWILLRYAGASPADVADIEEIQYWCRQELQRRDFEFFGETS